MRPLLIFAALAAAALKPFDNLVTFGDSYTDSGRLSYYIQHNGSAPPAGVLPDVTNVTASGGLAWGQYVQERLAGLTYLNYAISGATCSNQIISRLLAAIHKPFPSVLDDQIPSFEADLAGSHALYKSRTSDNTVYALWIGTNDLGVNAFLTDSQAPGTNLTSLVECDWQVLDRVYAAGGRRFVLFSQAPLQLSPLYAAADVGGLATSTYWQDKASYNQTAYQYKMLEYTTTVGTMLAYGAPFHLLVRQRWPGAEIALFDVHRLLTDIHDSPAAYLDAPAHAADGAFYHRCQPANRSDCVDASDPPGSYLWYDELHPSVKAASIIAHHFVNVVAGNSTYGTTYTS